MSAPRETTTFRWRVWCWMLEKFPELERRLEDEVEGPTPRELADSAAREFGLDPGRPWLRSHARAVVAQLRADRGGGR